MRRRRSTPQRATPSSAVPLPPVLKRRRVVVFDEAVIKTTNVTHKTNDHTAAVRSPLQSLLKSKPFYATK